MLAARAPEPSPARPRANPWRTSAQSSSCSTKPLRKQAELLPLELLIHHDMEPVEPEGNPIENAAVTR
jgi:hypothetical protein